MQLNKALKLIKDLEKIYKNKEEEMEISINDDGLTISEKDKEERMGF